MKRQTIRTIILLATISLVGIIATQYFWVKNAYNLEEKQFNERVNIALSNVSHQLLNMNHDESQLVNPVKQISSNYFIAIINDTVHPYLLETLLTNEFKMRNLHMDFEYVIYDCFTDSIVFGDYISLNNEDKNKLQSKSYNIKWDRDGHYFGVYFPSKRTYLINEMGIWVFSSSIILIIIIFFGYTISVILKQKRLSEIKNDFINNITHEFKTPISTISLSSDVLLQPNISSEPERIKSYAQIIKDENNRLKDQVDKVLQLATLEIDKLELENELIDLHEVINETVKSFDLILKNQHGKITCMLGAKKHQLIGDKVHVSSILLNLIDNAIKYSPENPRIEISTSNYFSGIEINVKDNGIGISKENQKHVFEKFYRVPTGDVHNIKGFGLGLNYVQTIVTAYRGKIKVSSKENEGSTFTVKLPFNT